MAASCHDAPAPARAISNRPGLRLSITGNPNVGKTSLVNAIAGTNLKVGNWAGVTVEKREAILRHGDLDVHLEDLPGLYSLHPSSPEEAIARRELFTNPPDVIINVLDAGNLERNLYLTLQMLELGVPTVIALNLLDEAEAKGMTVDPAALQAALGVPVVPTIASRGQGVHDLIPAAIAAAKRPVGLGASAAYPTPVESAVREVQACMSGPSARFAALALLEGDTDIEHLVNQDAASLARRLAARLEAQGVEAFLDIAEARYARAAEIARVAVPDPRPRRTLTDTLDGFFLHRYLGVPLFALVVLIVFRFTFIVAGPFVSFISGPFQNVITGFTAGIIPATGPFALLEQLLTGAIIPGVGTVLSFLPTLLALYLAMSFLEDSGYMARAAFLADRSMRGLGLEGKAFIPLVLGFGCNVPAVYATRTLERRNDRVLVSMILPFMSCSARLPVFVIFSAAFFPRFGSVVVWGLYLLGMLVAIAAAWLLRRTALPQQGGATVLELPPYRLPSPGTMLKHAVNHTKAFVHRAGTTVLVAVTIVWLLLATPARPGPNFAHVAPGDSLFGTVSQAVAPVFAPLGFGTWQAAGALIPGFVAKEVVVGTLGQIYVGRQNASIKPLGFVTGVGIIARDLAASAWKAVSALPRVLLPLPSAGGGSTLDTPLVRQLSRAYSPAGALAYLVFVLLYTPCVATISAIAGEHGRRLAVITVAYQLASAWLVALAVYNAARLLL